MIIRFYLFNFTRDGRFTKVLFVHHGTYSLVNESASLAPHFDLYKV
jgi:hypothetical protein